LSFVIHFPTTAKARTPAELQEWLTDQGEPFEQDGPLWINLRALPVRLSFDSDGRVEATVKILPTDSATRLTEFLFDLSLELGADVEIEHYGVVDRSQAWLHFAGAQDRARIVGAIEQAGEIGNRDILLRMIWPIISALDPERDLRWDVDALRIIEVVDDAIVPAPEPLHIPTWRWLADAFPNLTNDYR